MAEHNHIARGDVPGCPSCDLREGRMVSEPTPTPSPEAEDRVVLPPLIPEDFEMRWDEDHTFPFTEDEDATIMAYGHHDPEAFAHQVCEYDNLVAGVDVYDEPMDGSHVQHLWAVRLDHGSEDGWMIRWGGVTELTPEAFPVTVIIR